MNPPDKISSVLPASEKNLKKDYTGAGLTLNDETNRVLKGLEELAPAIDQEGYYPLETLQDLGKAGAYRITDCLINRDKGNQDRGYDLSPLIDFHSKIAETCLTTAFCAWCQTACVWYLVNTPNSGLRSRMLSRVEGGEVMAGTGLSNPMKAMASIEGIRLKAKAKAFPEDGGYRVDGFLPWVSNLSEGGYFGAVMQLPDNRIIAGLIHCGEGVTLKMEKKFLGLNGSATVGVRLSNYFLPREDLLAEDGDAFLNQIRPGFILLQAGMGIGNIRGSLAEIDKKIKQKKYLPAKYSERYYDLETRLNQLHKQIHIPLTPNHQTDQINIREILELRLALSYLSQEAAALLLSVAGSSGYLYSNTSSRRLRESQFVSIVTPSVTQLETMLA